MKKGIIYWFIILIIYGILLYMFEDYLLMSVFYHFLFLIFPLTLILLKKETFESIGIRKGNVKEGIKISVIIFFLLVAGIYLRSFLMEKSVYLFFDPLSLSFLLIVLFSPITEEIFIRGYLQTKLEKHFNKKIGLIISSILFALIHVPKMIFASEFMGFSYLPEIVMNPFVLLISFTVTGYILGYIFQETKSINYPIICHMIINFLLFTIRY